jgi:serine/threonine protein kinase
MARPSTALPGETLLGNRYALRERIGLGGMAAVWLAEDVRLGREVAVKILSEALAQDDAFLARFRREARIAAALTHPNLVSVFDFDPDAAEPYLVMEYVPGPNLAERLARGDVVDAERIAGDLLAALGAIHEAGVVHRDVKPANVLIAPGGRALLTDFGIARPEDATSITQTGQMPGTGRYMAPELLEGEPAAPATDLFSCGVLMQELPLGKASPVYRELAERLADPEPRRRPPSARAALAELPRRSARGASVPFSPDPPTEVVSTGRAASRGRTGSSTRRGSRYAAAGAVAAALAAIALVVTLDGDGDRIPGLGGDTREARGDAGKGEGEDAKSKPSAPKPKPGGGVPAPAAQADPAEAARLNDEGFGLIGDGRFEEAVPVLRRSVSLFGNETGDINYAYALFNLGHALREAGRAEEAVPVLRERLKFPDQTEVVRDELAAARAEAG